MARSAARSRLACLVAVCLVAGAPVRSVAQSLPPGVCERSRQALDLMVDEAARGPGPIPAELADAAALARTGAACYGAEPDHAPAGAPSDARRGPGCTLTDYEDSLRSFDLFAPADVPAPDSTWFAVFFATRAFYHLRLGHAARALGDYRTALAYVATRPAWLRAPLVVDAATAQLCAGDALAARDGFERVLALLGDAPRPSRPFALLRALADHGAAATLLVDDASGEAPRPPRLDRAAERLDAAARWYAEAGFVRLHAAAAALLAELDVARRAPAPLLMRRLDAAGVLVQRHGTPEARVRLALLRARVATEHQLPVDVPRVLEAAYQHAALQDRFSLPTLGVLNALGRWHEARGELDVAEAAYERAQRIVEVQRARRSPEAPPRALLAEEQAPFRGHARMLLARGDTVGAFRGIEEARGRYLRDLRAHNHAAARLEGADRVRYERLTAAVERIRTELAHPRSATHRAALAGEEARLVLARSALIHRTSSPPAPALADLRAHLRRRGAVLLSYVLEDAVSRPAVGAHAFVVDAHGLKAVPLPAAQWDTLRALVDRVSPVLRAPDGGGLEASRFSLAALGALYDLLVRPLAHLLPEGAPLIVIPEGPLVEIPFGLLARTTGTGYADADYLLRRHPVSVELAAAFLVEPTPPAGRGLVAFGKSTFGDLTGTPEDLLGGLPDASSEVLAAASRFAGGDVRLNAAATEPAFLEALREAAVVHVASHTVIRSGDPARSGVVLTPGGGADGIVYAHELQSAAARAGLVVLSGCATARGRYQPGEGMTGLHYALRAGGVPATVATLWRVDDAATRHVLSAFYRHLADGRAKDEALRRAQLAYLDAAGPLAASPYFWAGPVLYGDPAPPRGAPRLGALAVSPGALLLALAGLAAGALLRALHTRRRAGGSSGGAPLRAGSRTG